MCTFRTTTKIKVEATKKKVTKNTNLYFKNCCLNVWTKMHKLLILHVDTKFSTCLCLQNVEVNVRNKKNRHLNYSLSDLAGNGALLEYLFVGIFLLQLCDHIDLSWMGRNVEWNSWREPSECFSYRFEM